MTTPSSARVTPERIQQFAWGYGPPLILEAAIRHRVFDVLDGGAKTVAEVAQETGASERGLTAMMNALVGLDFLAKDGQAHYSLTPESSTFLVSHKPSFLGGIIRHGSQQLIPRWLNLNEVVAPARRLRPSTSRAMAAEFFQQFVNDILPAELSFGAGARAVPRLQCRGPHDPDTRSRRRLRSLGYRPGPVLRRRPRHRRGLGGGPSRHAQDRR